MHINKDEAIKRIRKALKERSGKSWSVTGGKGTAWGWLTVQAPPKRRIAHKPNPAWEVWDMGTREPAYFEYQSDDGRNQYTSDAECKELAELFGLSRLVHFQGVSISPDDREFYVTRAEG